MIKKLFTIAGLAIGLALPLSGVAGAAPNPPTTITGVANPTGTLVTWTITVTGSGGTTSQFALLYPSHPAGSTTSIDPPLHGPVLTIVGDGSVSFTESPAAGTTFCGQSIDVSVDLLEGNQTFSDLPGSTVVTCAPVAPTMSISATAPTTCNGLTVPVVLSATAGANLPEGATGDVTFGSGYTPSTGVINPGGTLDSSVTFPAADAGQTETVTAIVQWTGFDGNDGLTSPSTTVTLPAVCPVATTPPAATPPAAPAVPPVTGVPTTTVPSATTPPAAPVAHVVPAPAQAGLASTGAPIGLNLTIAAGLLLVGGVLTMIARRKMAA